MHKSEMKTICLTIGQVNSELCNSGLCNLNAVLRRRPSYTVPCAAQRNDEFICEDDILDCVRVCVCGFAGIRFTQITQATM